MPRVINIPRSGRGRTNRRRAKPPVERVAQNVLANVQKLSKTIHRQVYANGNGYTPTEIVVALGGKADHVLSLLESANAALVLDLAPITVAVTPTPAAADDHLVELLVPATPTPDEEAGEDSAATV